MKEIKGVLKFLALLAIGAWMYGKIELVNKTATVAAESAPQIAPTSPPEQDPIAVAAQKWADEAKLPCEQRTPPRPGNPTSCELDAQKGAMDSPFADATWTILEAYRGKEECGFKLNQNEIRTFAEKETGLTLSHVLSLPRTKAFQSAINLRERQLRDAHDKECRFIWEVAGPQSKFHQFVY